MKTMLSSMFRGVFYTAGVMVFTFATNIAAQSLKEVTEEECVYGDCDSGRGTLVLKTPWGLAILLRLFLFIYFGAIFGLS